MVGENGTSLNSLNVASEGCGCTPGSARGCRRKNNDLFSAVHWLASETATTLEFFFSNRNPAVHFRRMETDFITRRIETLAPTGRACAAADGARHEVEPARERLHGLALQSDNTK